MLEAAGRYTQRVTQIKGFGIRGLIKQIKNEAGADALDAILAHLSPAVAPAFTQQIISSRWYPYAVFAELLDAAIARSGGGEDYLRQLGRRTAAADFGTIFKMLAFVTSIDRLILRAPIFWKQYCDTGEFAVRVPEQGHGFVALQGVPEVSRAHCTLIGGWILGIGEAARAREPSVEKIRCVHEGAPHCEYEAFWRR